ncbi:SDR family oxidoreductase [Candidimonas humi]|jgi:NAD(P)-dependent dehydrogenase (short-subunit alcohol dehydrogenase family)|uniref:SDR family NAD(P)-dependent oxidoreductase n=1 Tax=Candidimonas humi TaxID=683355 RepID=A0ABV8NW28_9BURK|nr:SDR family NAD(P)-dependent oxidoreductase [Candidimonas humi]MBV6304336.1 SDR family oxidoreductase [Candidimonas humi]
MSEKRLEGRVALVFGAGSVGEGWGNGKAAAVAYAREGARVVAVDMNKAAAEETRDIIRAEGGRCEALAADATDSAQVAEVVAAALAGDQRIDILHNNVGMAKMGSVTELSEADWDLALAVNLKSAFLTSKHALPSMLERKSGCIINISSLAAIRYTGYPYPAYYAGKGGLNQFTVGLALQYAGSGIRVNAIMPGYIDTPLIYKDISGQYGSKEEMVAQRNALCPMGHMGTAWDIARAAVFLASDDAAYITGVCLPVDGGVHMASR